MSHETIVQPSRNGQQAADVIKTPDPEVVPKAERRRFGTEYKQRILDEDQYDWAIADFDKAIELQPGSDEAIRRRGDAFRMKAEEDRHLRDLYW